MEMSGGICMKKLELKKILPPFILLIGYIFYYCVGFLSIEYVLYILLYVGSAILLSHRKYGEWITGGVLLLNIAQIVLSAIWSWEHLCTCPIHETIELLSLDYIEPILLTMLAVAELVLLGFHIKNAIRKPCNNSVEA